jgi:hypothetical protein
MSSELFAPRGLREKIVTVLSPRRRLQPLPGAERRPTPGAARSHPLNGARTWVGPDVPQEPRADVARQVRKGEWLRLVADHGETAGRFSPQTYQTWRTDWLEADNTPLKYVVARLNRYSPKTIVVKGEGMSSVGVTGRFQLSRTNDALSMISALLGVDTVQSDGEISLSRKSAQDR